MKNKLLTIILAFSVSAHAFADEARLLRFPTTNGEKVVFSYAGDLYWAPIKGGDAHKLTSHIGYEMFPRYSPDGKTIAFTGQYDGNTEVYSLPDGGGEPLRVTYTATLQRDDAGDRMGPNNIVTGWTPDNKNIVYRSRHKTGSSFVGHLYTVDKEGGLSSIIPLPEGGFNSFAADGRSIAYNRVMREFRTWKYYQGGMADDIWIHNLDTRTTENITNNKHQDIFPMWIGQKIYFLSDRDRTMNLFSYDTQSKQTKKETSFDLYDIKFPSYNGDIIVFENGGYIYKFDTQTAKTEKITINLTADNNNSRPVIKNGQNYSRQASMAPNGERFAVTVRGEVFDVPVTDGVTRNISNTPGAHERLAVWSPDGKYIAYISDKTKETEIYLYDLQERTTRQLSKDNDSYITSLQWLPNSKSVLYTDRKNRLGTLDIASGKKTILQEDPKGPCTNIRLSFDGTWVTYTKTNDSNISVIYALELSSKKELQITDKWHSSTAPSFSDDGKYLFFSSARDFNPTYGSLEWNHIYNNMHSMYMVLLSNDTPSPFINQDPATPTDKVTAAKEGEKTKKIKIDTEGIFDRVIKMPLPRAFYYNIYCINNTVYYQQGGDIHSFNLGTKTGNVVSQGASMELTADRKKALVIFNGNLYSRDFPFGGNISGKGAPIGDIRIAVDYSQEWPQIFDEAWRHMRDGFYLENMHGVDWLAMRKKYEVLLPYVKHQLDLNYIIGEMIGELNCGHAYFNPGETQRADRISTGLLGAEVIRDKSGYFQITKILKGASYSPALRAPLDEKGLNVSEGNYIIAIDGHDLADVKNFYSLLVGKVDIPTELTINTSPKKAGARKIVIRPIDDESSLHHYQWVQNNIKKVEEASGGKIGYIYIPDMGIEGLNEFSRYFYPQLDKEGLIIDDRANGGGNVSPMILERLAREPYRLTMRRGSSRTGTVPDATQYGPKVCLINKYSASDGDLFPYGFRELGLGKLIGTRTWGGIVGISGSLPFIDGSDMRVPFFTSYSTDGEWIIENHGVDPDIIIDNDPAKEWEGVDQQLERAIEEVMNQLKDRKALPKAPSPRDFSK